jgi:hypothetical protein
LVCRPTLLCKDVVLLVITLLPLSGSTGSVVGDAISLCFLASRGGVRVVLSRYVWCINLVSHCFSPR